MSVLNLAALLAEVTLGPVGRTRVTWPVTGSQLHHSESLAPSNPPRNGATGQLDGAGSFLCRVKIRLHDPPSPSIELVVRRQPTVAGDG